MPDTDNERMVIIDAHLDLSWNALGWNRDLEQTVAAIRLSEAGLQEKGRGTNTVAFPDMRRGRIGIALATVLARCNPRGKSSIDFRTQEIASATAQGQLAYYRLLERRGACRILTDWPSLESSFSEWNSRSHGRSFWFHLEHGGCGSDCFAGSCDRLVSGRPARRGIGSLRTQRLCPRNREPRWFDSSRKRAVAGYGGSQSDPRHDSPGR